MLGISDIRRCHTFNYISYNIAQYLKYIIPEKANISISYNLITDDIPSVSKLFERSLLFLSSKYRSFLSIMLYTNDPTTSLYYTSLYNKLPGAFIYVDVVRDYFIDATLFYKSQRKIILYTKKLHIHFLSIHIQHKSYLYPRLRQKVFPRKCFCDLTPSPMIPI